MLVFYYVAKTGENGKGDPIVIVTPSELGDRTRLLIKDPAWDIVDMDRVVQGLNKAKLPDNATDDQVCAVYHSLLIPIEPNNN